jgi:hypothetical protein
MVNRWVTFLLGAATLSSGFTPEVANGQGTSASIMKGQSAVPAYVSRGDEIEKAYGIYRTRLETFFNALHDGVKSNQVELLRGLEPPAPVPYGYQIVPAIVPDLPHNSNDSRIKLSPFSWPRLEHSIERDSAKVDSLQGVLSGFAAPTGKESLHDYGPLVRDYKALYASQKLMANQIQYNRFWQKDIATHREWYNKLKVLQGIALEREQLRGSLLCAPDSAGQARADSLTRRIDDWIKKRPTPRFVEIEHPSSHEWIFRLPVYTDIDDSVFENGFLNAIETGWKVVDGGDTFRVKLDVRHLRSVDLYPGGDVPVKGAHIDVEAHVARFPKDGVVLTTGANAVRALDRAIILSSFPIRPASLVHEFGHMLGFKDGYFRSFTDLGSDGYEVLEVILPSADVVAAPEGGLVRRAHFEEILRERQQ